MNISKPFLENIGLANPGRFIQAVQKLLCNKFTMEFTMKNKSFFMQTYPRKCLVN